MFLDDEEYRHVVGLMGKEIQPSPLLVELKAWAEKEMQLKVYDYICDYTTNGMIRLRIVLWDHEAMIRMHKGANLDPKKQKKFQKVFAELAQKYNLHKEYWDGNSIFVCYETIKDEIQKRVLKQARSEIEKIFDPDIWRIEFIFEGIHIFYETDEQVRLNTENGKSRAIWQKCTEVVRKYDFCDAFKEGANCTFTSRQTLNEKYNGSMFFYMR